MGMLAVPLYRLGQALLEREGLRWERRREGVEERWGTSAWTRQRGSACAVGGCQWVRAWSGWEGGGRGGGCAVD